MKKKLFSLSALIVSLISSLYIERAEAQGIQLVANPDSGSVIDPGIIYNNKLCFGYQDTSGWYLSEYDGTGITIIPNPGKGVYYGLANVYNNKLYFQYQPE